METRFDFHFTNPFRDVRPEIIKLPFYVLPTIEVLRHGSFWRVSVCWLCFVLSLSGFKFQKPVQVKPHPFQFSSWHPQCKCNIFDLDNSEYDYGHNVNHKPTEDEL